MVNYLGVKELEALRKAQKRWNLRYKKCKKVEEYGISR